MKVVTYTLIAILLNAVSVHSQTPVNGNTPEIGAASLVTNDEAIRRSKVVTAVRISEKIEIDAQLDEPGWNLAAPATDFIQWGPRPGEQAVEQTEARFLYDEDNLYVGINILD